MTPENSEARFLVVFKYKLSDKDFQEYAPGAWLARMVTASDGRFRVGFIKTVPGPVTERAMWFEDVWYVVKGKMRLTCSTPPDFKEAVYEIGPGDTFFMGRGTRMNMETLEPFESLYCAMPASSYGTDYIIRQPVKKDEAHLIPVKEK